MNNSLINTFNLAPIEKEKEPRQVTVIDQRSDAQADFELARQNLLDLAENLKDSLKELITLADQSQSDRMYDALSKLAKTYIDANESLLKTHQTKQHIIHDDEKSGDVHNHLYITTEELLKIVNQGR